jgi:hypothetical protein
MKYLVQGLVFSAAALLIACDSSPDAARFGSGRDGLEGSRRTGFGDRWGRGHGRDGRRHGWGHGRPGAAGAPDPTGAAGQDAAAPALDDAGLNAPDTGALDAGASDAASADAAVPSSPDAGAADAAPSEPTLELDAGATADAGG